MTTMADNQQADQPQFSIQRVFLKDASYEAPNAPEIFRSQWQPQVNLDLNTRSKKLEDDFYEVILSLTITATNEDKTAFLVEIQQGGIFKVNGMDETTLSHTLGAFCPNILFPYAREAVDNLVLKGSFPPLMLAPVNFEALYQQSLQQQVQENEATATH
jgi:preprotein translocase subunit SecB